MKELTELTGIYHYMEEASPEARTAQALAQYQNMLRYNAVKMQKFKDWANPVKRAQMQLDQKTLEEKSKLIVSTLEDQPWIRSEKVPYSVKEK